MLPWLYLYNCESENEWITLQFYNIVILYGEIPWSISIALVEKGFYERDRDRDREWSTILESWMVGRKDLFVRSYTSSQGIHSMHANSCWQSIEPFCNIWFFSCHKMSYAHAIDCLSKGRRLSPINVPYQHTLRQRMHLLFTIFFPISFSFDYSLSW